MKRFYNNEDDDDKESFFDSDSDLDDNEDYDDDDLIGVIDQQGILDVMQMDLAQTQLNQDLLNKAIQIAENRAEPVYKTPEKVGFPPNTFQTPSLILFSLIKVMSSLKLAIDSI